MSIEINGKKVNSIEVEGNPVRYVYQGGTQIYPSGFNLDKACATTSAASGSQYIKMTLPRALGATMGFRANVMPIAYVGTSNAPCLFSSRSTVGGPYSCFGIKNSSWRVDGASQVSIGSAALGTKSLIGIGEDVVYWNNTSKSFTKATSGTNILTIFQSMSNSTATELSNQSVLAINFLDMWDDQGWLIQMRPIAVGDINPITNVASTVNGMINLVDGVVYGSSSSSSFEIQNW